MRRTRVLKILATFFLCLMVFIPVGYFIIYPNYNALILPFKIFSVSRVTRDTTLSFLTNISPSQDSVLGESVFVEDVSLEESLNSKDIDLSIKVLEDLETSISIPSIDVEGRVYQGVNGKTMDVGFWHFPITKYPGQKGNSVIIGHRYAKLPPQKDTFFNLDKLRVGDEIVVIQRDDSWKYIVTEIKEVQKNDVSVLQSSDDYRLTLITCSPLWSSDKRLVITAKLDKLYKKI